MINNDLELNIRRKYSENLENFMALKKWLQEAVGQQIIHRSSLYSYKTRIKTITSLIKKLEDKIESENKKIDEGIILRENAKWKKVSSYENLINLTDDLVGTRVITHINEGIRDFHEIILNNTNIFRIIEVTIHEFEGRRFFNDIRKPEKCLMSIRGKQQWLCWYTLHHKSNSD